MIVLDANVLIAFLDANDAHHDEAVRLLVSTRGEGHAVSVLTLAESSVHPASVGRGSDIATVVTQAGIRVLGLEPDVAPALATLRATTRLRLPDVVVLHAAQVAGDALATFDAALAAAATGVGVRVIPTPDIT